MIQNHHPLPHLLEHFSLAEHQQYTTSCTSPKQVHYYTFRCNTGSYKSMKISAVTFDQLWRAQINACVWENHALSSDLHGIYPIAILRHLIVWSKDQISLRAYKHCYRQCQQDTKSGRRPALRETCARRCTQGCNQLLICITECHRKHQATTCEHHMTNNLTTIYNSTSQEKKKQHLNWAFFNHLAPFTGMIALHLRDLSCTCGSSS